MELVAIQNLCGQVVDKNLGHVYYAPTRYFSISDWDLNPMARADKLFSEPFNTGYDWLSMPAIIKNKNIEGTAQSSLQGNSIFIDLPLYLPAYSYEIHAELAKMLHEYFVVKVKFADATYILGDINYPLKFSYKVSYGGGSASGVNINFSGNSPGFANKLAI